MSNKIINNNDTPKGKSIWTTMFFDTINIWVFLSYVIIGNLISYKTTYMTSLNITSDLNYIIIGTIIAIAPIILSQLTYLIIGKTTREKFTYDISRQLIFLALFALIITTLFWIIF